MTKATPLLALALAGCSTLQSRLDRPPQFSATGAVSLDEFNECFTRATGSQDIGYLPRAHGGTWKSTGGPQGYVFWLVTIEDLGSARRASVHAVNDRVARGVARKVQACL